jgi:hypothetical protein
MVEVEDQLLAGIWKSDFITGLCWHVEWDHPFLLGMLHRGEDLPPVRPEKWRAPSWSWASVKLPVFNFKMSNPRISYSILASIVEVKVDATPTGALKHAYLRGSLYTAEYFESDDFPTDGYQTTSL